MRLVILLLLCIVLIGCSEDTNVISEPTIPTDTAMDTQDNGTDSIVDTTPDTTETEDPETPEVVLPSSGCTADEEGDDYYVKGTASTPDGAFTDECISEKTLKEYFCNDNQLMDKEKDCYFSCAAGACTLD